MSSEPQPSFAERARTLAARQRMATLSTLALDPPGHPYGSLVAYAVDGATPLLLLSELAEHTRNLRADARASLLVAEPGDAEPLAHGRVTLLGRCSVVPDEERAAVERAYLDVHADAARFAGFRDFHFWRLHVEAVRYIAGFGRMSWVDGNQWTSAEPDPLAASAAGILAHMNEDHRETMLLYAKVLASVEDAQSASMTAVDRYGVELRVDTAAGPRPVRLPFARPVATADEVRAELVAMARAARK